MATAAKNVVTSVNNQIQSKNYIIDGDADGVIEGDFFSQLKHMLSLSHCEGDKSKDAADTLHDDSYCLLTKEPLHSVHIELVCGHKFNYVPLYREIIVQKTIGLSPNGYYTSHSLKRNEIKCPYCRNIQDKLLPYIQYDGVKKTYGVNYPAKMSMTAQLCMHTAASANNSNSKKGKKSAGASCKDFALECRDGIYLCKKHYHMTSSETLASETLAPTTASQTCGFILRYGKNKGTPCTNSSTCRIHLNKNKIESIQ